MKQNASAGEQSEAPRRRWKPGLEQHPEPENQDSQHMLNQPRGYFSDKSISFQQDIKEYLNQRRTNQKNSRRLELSTSKNTLHGGWGQGPGSVDPRFPAGLPFPVPEIPEFLAFRDCRENYPSDFPGIFLEFSSGTPEQTSIMCKRTRRFWGTDWRSPKSLSLAQTASLCSDGIERARKCLQG